MEYRCSVCGKSFLVGIQDNKGNIFCSEQCFQSTWPRCAFCGKSMSNWIEASDGKYCNEHCLRSSYPKCAICGKPMEQWITTKDGQKFCSETCFEKMLPKCSVCGKPVNGGAKDKKGNIYCSDSCFEKSLPKCCACGKSMHNWIVTKSGKVYCDNTCFEKTLPKCATCGKPLREWIESENGMLFCSETCLDTIRPKCTICGKPVRNGYRDSAGKNYCSDQCYEESLPKCSNCSKPVRDGFRNEHGVFCSEECFRVVHPVQESIQTSLFGFLKGVHTAIAPNALDLSSDFSEEENTMHNVTLALPLKRNSDGVLLHIKISEKCSGCGACSGMCDLFADGTDGKAVPANGGVTTKDRLEELQEAVDMCPDGAISLEPVSFAKESGTPTVADLRALVENILVHYEYPRPKYDDYKWTSYRPDVDGKGFYGWSRYDYSSYREAERAGVSELERVIFDHIDAHISTMLAEYKHEQLTPLITYTEDTNNFYYRENLRIKNLIRAIMLEVEAITKKKLANEIDVDAMNLVPDFGYNGKKFDGFCKIEEQTGMVKGDLESPDWYSSWVDTDDMDTTERGMFGGTKTVTKWAFRANGAMKEIFSHLNSGGKSEMRRYFEDTIRSRYQFAGLVEPMEEEVRKVGRAILSCLK